MGNSVAARRAGLAGGAQEPIRWPPGSGQPQCGCERAQGPARNEATGLGHCLPEELRSLVFLLCTLARMSVCVCVCVCVHVCVSVSICKVFVCVCVSV